MTPHDFVEDESMRLAPEFTRYLETRRHDFPWGDHSKAAGPTTAKTTAMSPIILFM